MILCLWIKGTRLKIDGNKLTQSIMSTNKREIKQSQKLMQFYIIKNFENSGNITEKYYILLRKDI